MLENKIKYLKYAMDHKLLLKLEWITSMFGTLVTKDYENEWFYIKDGVFNGKLDDGELIVLSNNYTEPILDTHTSIDIDSTYISNNNNKITTTIGRVVMNYLINVYCFNSKIPYINTMFTINTIEDEYILPRLTDDTSDPEGLYISEYKLFLDIGLFIDSFSKVLSIAATERSVQPPPGLKEYKKKIIAEAIKEHGKDALNDPVVIAELDNKLIEFDKEYLKNDPAYGKMISGKVANVARKKMFLTIGMGNTFEEGTGSTTGSLEDGWKLDPKTITRLNNDSRSGSFSRGKSTADGGVVAKMVLRATSDILIKDTDCKSKMYIPTKVTKENSSKLLLRFIIEGDGVVMLDSNNIDKYINKTVKLRTGLYCNLTTHFCTTCLGNAIKDYAQGIPIITSGVGSDMLLLSLAKFHGGALKVTKFDMDNLI